MVAVTGDTRGCVMTDIKNNSVNRIVDAGHRLVDDFQEDLMRRHKEAMEVTTLDDILSLLTGVVETMTDALNRNTDRFYRDPGLPTYDLRHELVYGSADLSAAIRNQVIKDAREFMKRGYEVIGVDELTSALVSMDKSIAALKKTCPEPDLAMIRRTGVEIERGEYLSVEEAFPDVLSASQG